MQKTSLIGFSRGNVHESCFQAINPSTGETLEPFYIHASNNEVNLACELAENAKIEFANLSGKKKGEFLRKIAQKIDDAVDEIVKVATSETGLPEARIRGETARTSGQLRMFADLVENGSWVDARIDPAIPDRQPIAKPDLRSMLRPVGPVAVFCASNFPLAFSVAGGDTASAFAAGCPVIVKAHHAHPGTALLVGEIIVEAIKESNLPEGVFSLLFGDGQTTGQQIVQHPFVKAVGFTGSRIAGRAIFDLASKREEPIPVFAEMSSINPIFLFKGMNEDRMREIADGLFVSVTLGTGQFCTNPGVVFYPEDNSGQCFKDLFLDKMNAYEPSAMLHSGIRDSYYKKFDELSLVDGVSVLCGENSTIRQNGCFASTSVFEVTLESFMQQNELSEEIFGPSTILVSYKDEKNLINAANQLEGQLTASIFGENDDLKKHEQLVSVLETKAGRLLFNQFPTGVEVCASVVHGGPYPATTDSRSTSVGTGAILRFSRPVCYQGFPDEFLPEELKSNNPLGILRDEN